MARTPHSNTKKGSEKWLQVAVNENQDILNELVAQRLLLPSLKIEWYSPLKCDDYAEYSDQDFIDLLELDLKDRPLCAYWPEGGPHWDGLARTDRTQVLLVEAKAHVGEIRKKGSGATSRESIEKIDCSLNETQKYLKSDGLVEWRKSPYYQYANRLAHLYLLAVLNGIDTYLLLVYFLNDSKMHGPASIDLWEGATHRQHVELGLPKDHPLSDRIIKLYIDVTDLGV